jgi:hypothetical protein
VSIGDPLLFVQCDVRAENNRSRDIRRLIVPYFLYVVMRVLKVIEAERYVDRWPLPFYTR